MAIKNAKIYGKFYSPEKLESYGKPFMFSLGSRSIGKSTGVGCRTLRNYLEKGEKFIYTRRTEDETMNTCQSFFDSAVRILRDNGYDIEDFKYDKRFYYLKRNGGEWEQCGCIVPLSQEMKYKSTNFEEYTTIIYDEFMAADSKLYLGSKANPLYEYDRILSLYGTVDRGIGKAYRNETKVFFLGNNSSYFNPIFMGLGINDYIRTDTKICSPKGALWVVEQTTEVEATKEMEKSNLYALSNQKNKDYIFNNIAFDNSMQFVEKITKPMQPIINVMYAGHKMGIYMVPDMGIVYVSNKPTNLYTIALTCGDQDKVNYTMALRFRDSKYMIMLREAYFGGNIRFETNKCKYEIANYFMLTP